MRQGKSGETSSAQGGRSRSPAQGTKQAYLLAFAVVVAIEILAVLWLLGSAGPSLLWAGGD
jgi:hypothetical protein